MSMSDVLSITENENILLPDDCFPYSFYQVDDGDNTYLAGPMSLPISKNAKLYYYPSGKVENPPNYLTALNFISEMNVSYNISIKEVESDSVNSIKIVSSSNTYYVSGDIEIVKYSMSVSDKYPFPDLIVSGDYKVKASDLAVVSSIPSWVDDEVKAEKMMSTKFSLVRISEGDMMTLPLIYFHSQFILNHPDKINIGELGNLVEKSCDSSKVSESSEVDILGDLSVNVNYTFYVIKSSDWLILAAGPYDVEYSVNGVTPGVGSVMVLFPDVSLPLESALLFTGSGGKVSMSEEDLSKGASSVGYPCLLAFGGVTGRLSLPTPRAPVYSGEIVGPLAIDAGLVTSSLGFTGPALAFK
ncbi:MAG: hypothetical protein GXO43_03875 [Crenarchaeota archaeon]|nr:hypothetical protein [Thermoproteota archaeon]